MLQTKLFPDWIPLMIMPRGNFVGGNCLWGCPGGNYWEKKQQQYFIRSMCETKKSIFHFLFNLSGVLQK